MAAWSGTTFVTNWDMLLHYTLVEEAPMKRTWHVSRDVLPHPDAQRRWDRAYQLVLEWALAADHNGDLPPLGHQEDRHSVSENVATVFGYQAACLTGSACCWSN